VSRFDEQGRLYVTSSMPVDEVPTSLMLYRANGPSAGITTGDYIQLRQKSPNPPEWFNLSTRSVLIDPPTNIGPIGGIANYELLNWRATATNNPIGYDKGDYLYEIVNAATGQSRWFNDGVELASPPPISEREIPGGELGVPVGGFGVTYDLLGGGTQLQGIWDIAHAKVYPRNGGEAIAIGTQTNNATNIQLIGAIERRHQDWIIIPRSGDTDSGLAQRAIAREFITQDISGAIVSSFWTNVNGQSIQAPLQQNISRAEAGFPPAVPIEYSLATSPDRLLNGFSIQLPNGRVEVYSDFGLKNLVASGTISTVQAKEISKGSPRYPTILSRTFLTANTEQTIALTSAKAIDIYNIHKTEILFGWSADSTQTVNCSPIQSSTYYFPQADINFTGDFAISVSNVPAPVDISKCSTISGSAVVKGLFGSSVVQGQSVTGLGIPANAFIKNKSANSDQITLCGPDGVTEVKATATDTNAVIKISGAVVKITVWS